MTNNYQTMAVVPSDREGEPKKARLPLSCEQERRLSLPETVAVAVAELADQAGRGCRFAVGTGLQVRGAVWSTSSRPGGQGQA